MNHVLAAAGNTSREQPDAALQEHAPAPRYMLDVVIVLVIAMLALLVRLWFVSARVMVEGDGVYYAALARNVLQGDLSAILNPYWSNLWIATIALFAWPSGDVVLAGRLASAITGAALVIPAYVVGRAGMGPRAGLLAAVLVAVQPWLLRFSSLTYSESLFNLLLLGALALAVAAVRSRSLWWWAALGLLTVLGMLTREAAGSIILLLPVLAWLSYRRLHDRRRVVLGLAVFAAVLFVGVGGRYATSRIVFGNWDNAGFGLKGAANLIIGDSFYDTVALESLVREVDSSGRSKYEALLQDGKAWEYVLSDIPALARRVAKNVYYASASSGRVLPPVPMSAPLPVRFFFIALGAYGVWACWRRAQDVAAIVAGTIVLTVGPLLLFFIHDRMVLPLAPLFCLVLAFGLADLAERSLWLRRLIYVLVICLTLLSVRWVLATPTIYGEDPVVQKEAGLWLHATQPQSMRLMAYDPFVPFYFYDDSPFAHYLSLPFIRSPQGMIDNARSQKADIIAVPEWYARLGGDGVAPLLTPDGAAPAGLERLVVLGTSPTRMFIYRLLPAP